MLEASVWGSQEDASAFRKDDSHTLRALRGALSNPAGMFGAPEDKAFAFMEGESVALGCFQRSRGDTKQASTKAYRSSR